MKDQESVSSNSEIKLTVEKSVMKAAVLTAPGHFDIMDVPLPQIREDEILVELEGCGLCASGIPLWEGREWFEYPRNAGEPGHEGWGRVYKTGKKVTRFNPGDRVGMLSYKAFAQFDVAREENAVKLPESLGNLPFAAEPLACAMNIFHRSDIQRNQTVAIVGAGFLGCLLIPLAKNAGARIIVLSGRDTSLEYALQMGADDFIKLDDHWKVIEKVNQLTGGKGCDRVVEATGKQWPLDVAGELVMEGGKMIIAGYHQDGLRNINMQLWNWKGIDVINAHERDPEKYISGMKKALHAVEEKLWDPFSLMTHSFKFEDINRAHATLLERPESFMKAYLKF